MRKQISLNPTFSCFELTSCQRTGKNFFQVYNNSDFNSMEKYQFLYETSKCGKLRILTYRINWCASDGDDMPKSTDLSSPERNWLSIPRVAIKWKGRIIDVRMIPDTLWISLIHVGLRGEIRSWISRNGSIHVNIVLFWCFICRQLEASELSALMDI